VRARAIPGGLPELPADLEGHVHACPTSGRESIRIYVSPHDTVYFTGDGGWGKRAVARFSWVPPRRSHGAARSMVELMNHEYSPTALSRQSGRMPSGSR
jgi:hypothetical protein